MLNGWFIALVVLAVLNIGINLAKHGQPREGNYSFWASLIGAGIQIWLTYMAIIKGVN